MPTYDIELRKTIVVTIEADSKEEAIAEACEVGHSHDGAWDRALADAVVLSSEGPDVARDRRPAGGL